MLKPAILYKDAIFRKMQEYYYSDDMLYYMGSLDNFLPNIAEEPGDNLFQYAIIDSDDKLIGFFTYSINWYSSIAHNFGVFSFDRSNHIVGFDVYKELLKLINDYKLHKLEWRMVGGNPVERHYDRFCKKYNGNKIILRDCIKDKFGKYHDDIIYEVFPNEK